MTKRKAPIEPPREGLIPGTWKVMDPTRLGSIVDRPRMPSQWTPRHVGMRLIEAHRVLARVPMNLWPKQYGTAWPSFPQEAPALKDRGDRRFVSDRNRTVMGASADEIDRMSEAICWPLQFLSASQLTAADVNLWCSQVTEEEFEKIADGDLSVPWDGLQMIADALNTAGEVVR
jgi:hypothetical protein